MPYMTYSHCNDMCFKGPGFQRQFHQLFPQQVTLHNGYSSVLLRLLHSSSDLELGGMRLPPRMQAFQASAFELVTIARELLRTSTILQMKASGKQKPSSKYCHGFRPSILVLLRQAGGGAGGGQLADGAASGAGRHRLLAVVDTGAGRAGLRRHRPGGHSVFQIFDICVQVITLCCCCVSQVCGVNMAFLNGRFRAKYSLTNRFDVICNILMHIPR